MHKYFTQAQETLFRQYKREIINQTQISKLLNEAYGRAVTVTIAKSAFRASGIWLVNRHIFQDYQFAPSDILQYQHCNSSAEIAINTANSANTSVSTLLNDSESSNNHSAVDHVSHERKIKKFKDILHELSSPSIPIGLHLLE
ncbi:hypothetical protein K0M31_010807 [Melipona bicolor]|uniref:Uncharacterized protein n=1 Tax=Melipona bicolor TaxID=60889 RepID=A0AA40KI63_9HYME|nr:hypothetical protein K0M31_010807 [Melipona bicolor]